MTEINLTPPATSSGTVTTVTTAVPPTSISKRGKNENCTVTQLRYARRTAKKNKKRLVPELSTQDVFNIPNGQLMESNLENFSPVIVNNPYE